MNKELTGYFYSRQDFTDFNVEEKSGGTFYYGYGVACTEVEIDVLTGENQVL